MRMQRQVRVVRDDTGGCAFRTVITDAEADGVLAYGRPYPMMHGSSVVELEEWVDELREALQQPVIDMKTGEDVR